MKLLSHEVINKNYTNDICRIGDSKLLLTAKKICESFQISETVSNGQKKTL